MAIQVTEADFEHDLDDVIRLFEAGFGMEGTRERFEWLYRDNPDGRAIAWFAVDDRDGARVGCTAVFPRRVRFAGHERPVMAWNCGDFVVLKQYRTLGTAVTLRRAARAGIDAGQAAFLYAHPNDRMLAVHLRAGHGQMGTMGRWARPLQVVDRGAALRWFSRPALRLWRRPRRAGRFDVELVPADRLPPDIDGVDEATAGRIGTALVRDRAYLGWRFGRNPVERSEALIARQGGRPVGYLVFTMKAGSGVVKDWLAATPEARDELFAALLGELWGRDARSASVIALDTHPDLAALSRAGFLRRPESSAVVTYAPAASPMRPALSDPARWYMTVGDRDV